MYFFYDNTGAPIALWYFPKGGARVTGYYFTNAQGDVTRIEDPNGNVLATYAYDAWGRNYSASGSMQNINPLRYRGYYQDAETNFYYLQSRYYDPSIARFINADSYASTGQGFLGYNMFAYCGNNPVSRVDADGNKYTMVNDNVFGGGGAGLIGIIGLFAISQSMQNTIAAQSKAISQEKEQEKDAAISSKKKDNRPQFPVSPDSFFPKGLKKEVRVEKGEGKNGGIIQWVDSISNTPVFEWDEDLTHGAHYHAIKIEWGGKHIGQDHYKPGDYIPEPWASIYFEE